MSNEPVVYVHIVGNDVPAPNPRKRERRSTMTRYQLVANTPTLILGYAPNRYRAIVGVIGQSTDIVYFGNSSSAVQNGQGAPFMAGATPIEFTGSDEIWIYSATTPLVGVVAEYRDTGTI